MTEHAPPPPESPDRSNPYVTDEVPKELVLLPRSVLLRRGFRAVAESNPASAHDHFGAAIRKARRLNLWDLEAEFYKFVTLYIHGEYAQAVKRCLVCLDGAKSLWEIALAGDVRLPADPLIKRLSECLAQTMAMRHDGFWSLVRHFNHVHEGEFYMGKKARGFTDSISKAWRTTAKPQTIGFDLLKNELAPFTAFYLERYAALTSEADREREEREFAMLEKEEAARGMHSPEEAAPGL